MKTFLKSALLLTTFLSVSGMAANQQIVIPRGTKVEKYKYTTVPNNEPASLSVCGVYSKLSNEDVLNKMTFKYNSGPYYQYLKTNSAIALNLESENSSIYQGTDCDYKGFGYEDPDWNCTTAASGYWMQVVMTFKDADGNTWSTYNKTKLTADKSDLPSESALIQQTLDDIKNRMPICR